VLKRAIRERGVALFRDCFPAVTYAIATAHGAKMYGKVSEATVCSCSRGSAAGPHRSPPRDPRPFDKRKMMTPLRLGLVVSTVGRPALLHLLLSAAAAAQPPEVVGIANQATRRLGCRYPQSLPFVVRQVTSSGGVSQGRNDAFALLADDVDIVATPNDDTRYGPDAFVRARAMFGTAPAPDAVAGALLHGRKPRFTLPPDGTPLDRRTVWRATEPALFLRASSVRDLRGFRTEIGVGGPSPWQSGEGTDLLLRLLDEKGRVVSAPTVRAYGEGERRDLTDREWVLKNRRYARGTGYVYRIHGYPWPRRLAIVAAPWIRAAGTDGPAGQRLRIAKARSLGRAEGLLGRALPTVSAGDAAR
jgi:hypothetical protein